MNTEGCAPSPYPQPHIHMHTQNTSHASARTGSGLGPLASSGSEGSLVAVWGPVLRRCLQFPQPENIFGTRDAKLSAETNQIPVTFTLSPGASHITIHRGMVEIICLIPYIATLAKKRNKKISNILQC